MRKRCTNKHKIEKNTVRSCRILMMWCWQKPFLFFSLSTVQLTYKNNPPKLSFDFFFFCKTPLYNFTDKCINCLSATSRPKGQTPRPRASWRKLKQRHSMPFSFPRKKKFLVRFLVNRLSQQGRKTFVS